MKSFQIFKVILSYTFLSAALFIIPSHCINNFKFSDQDVTEVEDTRNVISSHFFTERSLTISFSCANKLLDICHQPSHGHIILWTS